MAIIVKEELQTSIDSTENTSPPSSARPRGSAVIPPRRTSRSRILITHEEFLNETAQEERNALRLCLDSAIVNFVEDNLPVYLERLGIIFSDEYSKLRVRSVGQSNLVFSEKIRTLKFEKCSEIVAYHKEVHRGVVGIKEISSLMYPRISGFVEWSEKELQRYLRGFILGLRDEIIIKGQSTLLESVGTLFSLHNRQGNSLADWFAGADIFLSSNYKKIIEIGESKTLPRPIFDSAWEPIESLCGAPIEIFEIDLVAKVSELQCESAADRETCVAEVEKLVGRNRLLPVAAFKINSKDSAKSNYLFCTNGLRRLALDQLGSMKGIEFVFHIELEKEQAPLNKNELINISTPMLVASWIVSNSTHSKTVREGMGINSSAPLFPIDSSSIRGVLFTRFSLITSEQLTPQGEFSFVNIIGITDGEAKACKKLGSEYLIKVLRHRKLDQVTRPTRLSVLYKTGFENGQLT